MNIRNLFTIVLAIFLLFVPKVLAEEGFKAVNVTKQGTTQASITAQSIRELSGNISISKVGGYAFKVCQIAAFHTGVPSSPPCVVTGLATGVVYNATATGSDTLGNTYTKNQEFYMGNTAPANMTDVCSNIPGVQTTIPAGMIAGNFGECVAPSSTTPTPAPQPPAPASPATPLFNPNGTTATSQNTADQCNDGKDNQLNDGIDYGFGVNMGDGKADHKGVDIQWKDGKDYGLGLNNGDGKLDFEPDPSCFSPTQTEEKADDVARGADGMPLSVIPCTDKCTFGDVFRLLNNLLTFFITKLLIPIFVTIIMYAGFKYITAEGNPSKIANLKKMIANIVLGIVLILCSWLIVRTIMTTLLNDKFKESGVEFLGK